MTRTRDRNPVRLQGTLPQRGTSEVVDRLADDLRTDFWIVHTCVLRLLAAEGTESRRQVAAPADDLERLFASRAPSRRD